VRVALLGPTGQIGRGLVRALSAQHELMLYARRPPAMRAWLAGQRIDARVFELEEFPTGRFDLVISAIGDGVPGKIKAAGDRILETTERFDRQCLDHLDRGSASAYVFLSTGRIYGAAYEAALEPDPQPLAPDSFAADEAYPRAKRLAELRHRERPHQHIADIRIFGYVSDEIGLDDDFLVAQMLRALVDEYVFLTAAQDFVRDYVGPEDLAALIGRLIAADVPNGEYDICSARPTTKFEMLDALSVPGLRYSVEGGQEPVHCSERPEMISRHGGARAIGHTPARTSLENVLACAAAIHAREALLLRQCAP
jgi:nucleoside-diphosphate-sugar epimerase